MIELGIIPADLSPLWISLRVPLLATFLTFILGLATAYWMLGDRSQWKSWLEGIFIAPLILPPTVVGFLLLLFFGKNGPVGQLLMSLDLLFLKFDGNLPAPQNYHIQAELFKEKWETLKQKPVPWQVQLSPLRLILLEPI
jgi:ABC-type sugar transport system permease subunit